MKKEPNIENLYKKSATETSPKDLDNLILAQAKASCDKQFNKPNTVKRTWLYGLSTAAVFVMGLSMTIHLQTINEQVILPVELDKFLLKKESVELSTSKKIAKKNAYDAKQKPDSKPGIIKKEPLLESPMPQATRLSSESSQVGFSLEEVIQEADDDVQSDSPNLIQHAKEKSDKKSLSRSLKDTPEKKLALGIGDYISVKKPVPTKKQESFEQPEITAYDMTKVIVRNEDAFTPTQKKIVKAVELHESLQQFQSLIEQNKKQQAKELLMRLTQEYPGYDFRVYYQTLQNLK